MTLPLPGAPRGPVGARRARDVDAARRQAAADDHPVVVLDTTLGPITIELDRAKAPITVDNFLKYVDAGFYDGLIFHRVIPGFMIQGGGMRRRKMNEKTEGPGRRSRTRRATA